LISVFFLFFYETDDSYRLHFQQWVQKLWEEKDARLEALRNGQ